MVELVDTYVSEAYAARYEGSSPSSDTEIICYNKSTSSRSSQDGHGTGLKNLGCWSESNLRHKMFKLWVILAFVLIGIHAHFVPKQNFFEWSEVEKIEIKQRMDEYPPQFYRLANILENKMKYFYRAEKIFFNYLNF